MNEEITKKCRLKIESEESFIDFNYILIYCIYKQLINMYIIYKYCIYFNKHMNT